MNSVCSGEREAKVGRGRDGPSGRGKRLLLLPQDGDELWECQRANPSPCCFPEGSQTLNTVAKELRFSYTSKMPSPRLAGEWQSCFFKVVHTIDP